MRISIVVPTCHRNDLLARCLDGLAPGTQHKGGEVDFEVIVSDDGSRTTARELVAQSYPWARWVAGPRRGPASNRNNGARAAAGDWLVFLDDDCIPDPGFAQGYADAIAVRPACNVFEGRTYADRPRRSLAESAPENESGGCLWSCNFAIRKSVFEAMNGFDERFPYPAMEDVEFRLRLRKRSEEAVFVKSASVCHPWRPIHVRSACRQYEEAVLIYLGIHPDEAARFTPGSYLWNAARAFLRFTVPALWKYHGAGVGPAIYEHLFHCRLAWRLWRRKNAAGGGAS